MTSVQVVSDWPLGGSGSWARATREASSLGGRSPNSIRPSWLRSNSDRESPVAFPILDGVGRLWSSGFLGSFVDMRDRSQGAWVRGVAGRTGGTRIWPGTARQFLSELRALFGARKEPGSASDRPELRARRNRARIRSGRFPAVGGGEVEGRHASPPTPHPVAGLKCNTKCLRAND